MSGISRGMVSSLLEDETLPKVDTHLTWQEVSQICLCFKPCIIVWYDSGPVKHAFPGRSDCGPLRALDQWAAKDYSMHKYMKLTYVNILSCSLLVRLCVKRFIKQRDVRSQGVVQRNVLVGQLKQSSTALKGRFKKDLLCQWKQVISCFLRHGCWFFSWEECMEGGAES